MENEIESEEENEQDEWGAQSGDDDHCDEFNLKSMVSKSKSPLKDELLPSTAGQVICLML